MKISIINIIIICNYFTEFDNKYLNFINKFKDTFRNDHNPIIFTTGCSFYNGITYNNWDGLTFLDVESYDNKWDYLDPNYRLDKDIFFDGDNLVSGFRFVVCCFSCRQFEYRRAESAGKMMVLHSDYAFTFAQ